MPSVSMVWGPTSDSADFAVSMRVSASGPSITTATPGLVHIWPALAVSEPAQPLAMASPRVPAASGRMNMGLTEPSSPKNGMGSGRAAQRSNSALPPRSEPVKPTALINGCWTRAAPTSLPPP
jgi:hypothetical protein